MKRVLVHRRRRDPIAPGMEVGLFLSPSSSGSPVPYTPGSSHSGHLRAGRDEERIAPANDVFVAHPDATQLDPDGSDGTGTLFWGL